jgi:hypothetical protein
MKVFISGRKHLQVTYLINNLYPKSIKSSGHLTEENNPIKIWTKIPES